MLTWIFYGSLQTLQQFLFCLRSLQTKLVIHHFYRTKYGDGRSLAYGVYGITSQTSFSMLWAKNSAVTQYSGVLFVKTPELKPLHLAIPFIYLGSNSYYTTSFISFKAHNTIFYSFTNILSLTTFFSQKSSIYFVFVFFCDLQLFSFHQDINSPIFLQLTGKMHKLSVPS